MTLNQLEQDLYRRLGFATASPDTATQTRLRAFLNETQQEIVSEPGMERLLYDTITFASVASQAVYALPPVVSRIRTIRDATNLITLTPESFAWWRHHYPSPTALTGTAEHWIDLGLVPVSSQPTAAAELFIKSTSASDTGTAYVEGYRTSGYFLAKSKAMTGVTAVSFDTTITDWIEVTKLYLSAAAVGTVTLHMTSGAGTTLATIPIGQTYARYRAVALAICPSSVLTYSVDHQRDVTDMAIATDEPMLPYRFHRMLVSGARKKEYEKQDQMERWKVAALDYDRDIRKLKFYLANQAEGSVTLQGTYGSRRPSQLGAWYPAGT